MSSEDEFRDNLRKLKLEGLRLSSISLRRANLQNFDLERANLEEADLREANLSGARIQGAFLKHAILVGANLRNADLSYAEMRFADLGYADLTGANLNHTDLIKANLNGAKLKNTILQRMPSPWVWQQENGVAVRAINNRSLACAERTKQTVFIGVTIYKPGHLYVSPLFSRSGETMCHPRLYVGRASWHEHKAHIFVAYWLDELFVAGSPGTFKAGVPRFYVMNSQEEFYSLTGSELGPADWRDVSSTPEFEEENKYGPYVFPAWAKDNAANVS